MFKQRIVLTYTVITLFITQCTFWLIFLNYDQLPPEVPLWNLMPWGSERLAVREMIWLLPGFSIGYLAINLIIAAIIQRFQPFLIGLVMASTAIFSGLILLGTINILGRLLGWF